MPPLGSKVKLKFRGKDREIRIHVYRPTVTMASIVISDSDSDTESAIPPISVNISAIPSSVTEAKRSPIKKRRRNQKSSEDEFAKIAAKIEKMKQKEEIKRQRDFDKALKKAMKDTRKESQAPADRLRHMVLVLDSTLSENSDLMESLVEELEEAGVEYRVGKGGPVGGVRWRRKQLERTVSDDAQISEMISESDEKELLLTLDAQGFAGLVQCTKMAEQGTPLPAGSHTLQQYIEAVQRDSKDVRVSLAVQGMDAYFRGNKTKRNRQFRKRVLGTTAPSHDSPDLPEVTWLDCHAAIVSLQLQAGCTVRLCAGPEKLAEYIITLTKAVCERPFRKESHFSFHPDAASGNKKRVESGTQLVTTWKNQLMQFNNFSESMASAVVSEYPTPAHLISAYSLCDEGALLLQDISVRRGVGTVASTRRLGPVQSRRVHSLLTSTDPHITLT